MLSMVVLSISCSRSLHPGIYVSNNHELSYEYSWYKFSTDKQFVQNQISDTPPFKLRRVGQYSIHEGQLKLMYSCEQQPTPLIHIDKLSHKESENFYSELNHNQRKFFNKDSVFIQVIGAKGVEIFKGKIESPTFSVDVPLNLNIQPVQVVLSHHNMMETTYFGTTRDDIIQLSYCDGFLYTNGLLHEYYDLKIKKNHLLIDGSKYYPNNSE